MTSVSSLISVFIHVLPKWIVSKLESIKLGWTHGILLFSVNVYLMLTMKGLRASPVAQQVKNLPAMQDTWVQSLGWEGSLEKGTAIHFSILAWRIPRTTSDMTGRLSHSLSLFFSWKVWSVRIQQWKRKSKSSCNLTCSRKQWANDIQSV